MEDETKRSGLPRLRAWALWVRIPLAVGATLLYALAFLPLRRAWGAGASALSLLPLVVVGLCFGLRGGPLAGLLLFLLNLLLLVLGGEIHLGRLFLEADWAGFAVLVLMGAVVGWLSDVRERLSQELARREQAEAALLEQSRALEKERARAQQYLDVASTMIVALDLDGRVTLISRRGCELLGCEEADAIGEDWFDTFVPERRRDDVRAIFERLMAGEVGSVEWVMDLVSAKDGEERLVLWHNAVLTDEAGEVVGVLSSGEDVTERERAKEGQTRTLAGALRTAQALRESEARYRSLFEHVPVGLYRLAPDGRLLEVNRTLVQMLGYPDRETLMEINTADIYVEPDECRQWLTLLESGDDVSDHEVQWCRHDGAPIWVQESARAVHDDEGRVLYYECAVEDIAGHKQVEGERESLLAAEREQRLMAEALTEVTVALTSQVNYKVVMDEILHQVQRVVPYSTANIALVEDDTLRAIRWRGYEAFSVEDLAANLTSPLADLPLDAEAVHSQQSVVVADVGQEQRWGAREGMEWIRSHLAVPISLGDRVLGLLRLDSDAQGSFSAEDARRLRSMAGAAAIAIQNAQLVEGLGAELVARMVDVITERGKSEAILRSMGDAVAMSDLEGRVEYVNDAYTASTGYAPEEVIGKPTDFLVEAPEQVLQSRQAALERGEVWRGKAVIRHKDGRACDVALTVAPVCDEEGRLMGYVASHRDIG